MSKMLRNRSYVLGEGSESSDIDSILSAVNKAIPGKNIRFKKEPTDKIQKNWQVVWDGYREHDDYIISFSQDKNGGMFRVYVGLDNGSGVQSSSRDSREITGDLIRHLKQYVF